MTKDKEETYGQEWRRRAREGLPLTPQEARDWREDKRYEREYPERVAFLDFIVGRRVRHKKWPGTVKAMARFKDHLLGRHDNKLYIIIMLADIPRDELEQLRTLQIAAKAKKRRKKRDDQQRDAELGDGQPLAKDNGERPDAGRSPG